MNRTGCYSAGVKGGGRGGVVPMPGADSAGGMGVWGIYLIEILFFKSNLGRTNDRMAQIKVGGRKIFLPRGQETSSLYIYIYNISLDLRSKDPSSSISLDFMPLYFELLILCNSNLGRAKPCPCPQSLWICLYRLRADIKKIKKNATKSTRTNFLRLQWLEIGS